MKPGERIVVQSRATHIKRPDKNHSRQQAAFDRGVEAGIRRAKQEFSLILRHLEACASITQVRKEVREIFEEEETNG